MKRRNSKELSWDQTLERLKRSISSTRYWPRWHKQSLAMLLSALLVLSVGVSGQKLKQQIQRQTDFLEDELVIDMHEYSQLQRELLRLKSFVASTGKETVQSENSQTDAELDAEQLDTEQITFHVDLVQSRVTILQVRRSQDNLIRSREEASLDEMQSLLKRWEPIKKDVLKLSDDSVSPVLRQTILAELASFEIEVNKLSLANSRQHWRAYETLIDNQSGSLNLLLYLLASFFIFAAVFSGFALRFTQSRQQLLEELEQASTTDELTKIANRRYFNQVFLQEWNRTLREQQYIGLLLCDVDHFKKYNDLYGHQQGDMCLLKVAQQLSQTSHRAGDFVARYGGEEFIIILPNTSIAAVQAFSKLLHQNIYQAALPHHASLVSNYVTLSVGIAVGIPTPGFKPEEALKCADEALYEAKAKGRKQSCQRVFNLKRSAEWPQRRSRL